MSAALAHSPSSLRAGGAVGDVWQAVVLVAARSRRVRAAAVSAGPDGERGPRRRELSVEKGDKANRNNSSVNKVAVVALLLRRGVASKRIA